MRNSESDSHSNEKTASPSKKNKGHPKSTRGRVSAALSEKTIENINKKGRNRGVEQIA